MKMIGILFIIFIFSLAAFQRNILWREDTSLWEDTVLKTPNRIRPHINLGVSYVSSNILDKAIIEYRKAIEITDNFYSRYNLGIIYEKKAHNDIAIKEFRNAITKSSEIPKSHTALAYYKIGRLYLKKDLYDEAIMNFEQAVKLNPDFYEVYNDLGIAYGKKGLIDKAINEFQVSLKINPDYAVAHYNMGITFEGIGFYKKALSEYQIALELDPADEKTKSRINILQNRQLNR